MSAAFVARDKSNYHAPVMTPAPSRPRDSAALLPMLSIIIWPDGLDREQAAALLAEHSGLDLPTLRLRLGSPPPLIVGQVSPDAAERAINAWTEAGGSAFAPTIADLEALGPTLKIRDLRVEPGRLVVDLWRGEGAVIACEAVQILIRAHLRESRIVEPVFSANRLDPRITARALGSPMGLAATIHLHSEADGRTPISEPVTSDKLDLHTADGRVFQIDGDKFAYHALGNLRGHSDRANMDKMCELLAHLAPNEIVDDYCALWKPPPFVNRLRLPQMTYNREVPAFAFYSRWAALMYRHLLNESAPGRQT